jgi:hypothetical protein
MTYPLQPTERDHERFRDACKHFHIPCDFDRNGIDGGYKSAVAVDLFRIWWSAEKERQLLQNLNQSQGAEITRLMNKTKQLEAV